MSVDVSPDGETLVFDLLGDIYWMPFEGGEAAPLTSGRPWDQAPRFSPDGKYAFFVSDRVGFKSVWQLRLADQSLQQITRADSHILGGPTWSQDKRHLLVGLADVRTANSEIILHSIDTKNGSMAPIDEPNRPWVDMDTFTIHRPAIRVFSGTGSVDGKIFFSQAQRNQEQDRMSVRLYEHDVKTQKRTELTASDVSYDEYKPQLSHNGDLLAYFRQYNDRRTEIRILNRTTGRDKALITLTNADDAFHSPMEASRPNYAFTPDDRQIIFWHGGKIHSVRVGDGESEIIPLQVNVRREVWERAEPPVRRFSEVGEADIIRWPSLSHDGQTMAFSAIGYIWLMDLTTGQIRRLTRSDEFEYMPALSPDGEFCAYVSFAESDDGDWTSRLMVTDLGGEESRELLAATAETYLIPNWSPNGSMIAMIREVEGKNLLEAAVGWTLVTDGAFNKVASVPASSEHLSWPVYARSVSFDKLGRNLLYSYRRSRKETILVMAGLDGSQQRTLAIGTPEVDGITPAPNLKNLALTRRDGTVWVVPFDAGQEAKYVSTSSLEASRASIGGGYYVSWDRPDRFTFGFGQNVYRYEVDQRGPEADPIQVRVAFPKPMAAQPIAFTGARLISVSDDDGATPVIESGSIVLSGQRIAAIGRRTEVEIPSNAIVFDATGKTIMPGILDTHYHRVGGDTLSALKLPNRNFSDDSAIAYGITTAWEPGGPTNDGAPATVDLQRAGRILGPRWLHSATGSIGYPWEQLTTYARALAAVEQHRALGVSVLKEYNAPTREQQQWLSTAAHQKSLAIVSHIQTFDGMMTRIIDGYTGGDHPYIPVPFFKDVREMLRQTGYFWTPNILIASGSLGGYEDIKHYFWRVCLNKHPRELDKLEAMTPSDRANQKDFPIQQNLPYESHRVSRVAEQVGSAARSGIHIGISGHNMPGINAHREMWYLWKGGMPIEDVLRAATMGNAEKLGLQAEIGSLEPGKIADFLVLDRSPLDDICNTLSLHYTVQGGVVYDSDTAQRADLLGIQ